jgi:hypothetical protein
LVEHALFTQGVAATGLAPAVQKALNASQALALAPAKLLQGEVFNTHVLVPATQIQAPAVESVHVRSVE